MYLFFYITLWSLQRISIHSQLCTSFFLFPQYSNLGLQITIRESFSKYCVVFMPKTTTCMQPVARYVLCVPKKKFTFGPTHESFSFIQVYTAFIYLSKKKSRLSPLRSPTFHTLCSDLNYYIKCHQHQKVSLAVERLFICNMSLAYFQPTDIY